MFKKYFLLLFSCFFLIQFSQSQNTEKVAIFYQNDTIENGKIIFYPKTDKPILFLKYFSKDTITLDIQKVKNISFIKEDNQVKTNYQSKLRANNLWGLFKNIHPKGKYPIYKLLGNKEYYLELDSLNFLLIPNDKMQKKALFYKVSLDSQLVINNFAFKKGASTCLKFADHLEFPFPRYPSFYLGLKFSYGNFKMKNISKNPSILIFLPEEETNYRVTNYSGALTLNNKVSRNGRFVSNIAVGLNILELKGHFSNQSPEIAFSTKGYFAQGDFGGQYYLNFKKLFPYFKASVKASYLLKEKSLFLTANEGDNNITQLEYYPLQAFNNLNWTPVLGFGMEIPITKQHFLTFETAFSTMADIRDERNLLIDFSIGINIL